MPIVINSNRTHGYSAEPNDENRELYETLKHQCRAYINSEFTNRYGDNPRIAYLIRKLLCTNDYVKAEDLVDEMSISIATLTNDLRYVRILLEKYDIQLVSTPYYGMKLNGHPCAIRSCMIDVCDLYDVYRDSWLFEQGAVMQFNLDLHRLKEIRHTLVSCLQKMNLQLQEQGFLRVLMNLMILCGSSTTYQKINQPIELIDKQSSPYQCAMVVCQHFAIHEVCEIEYMALLITLGSDNLNESLYMDSSFAEDMNCLYEQVIYELKNSIHLDLEKKLHIVEIFRRYLYAFFLKKANHVKIYNNLMNQLDIVRNIPVSNSLALQMLSYMKNISGYTYDEQDVISLTIQLFNAIFIVPNEYHKVHIAFIGPFSADTCVSVGYRMSLDERHNVHKDFYAYHDVDHIDFTKYDSVFVVSSCGLQLKVEGPEVFYIDYFYHYESSRSFFDQVLAKHRIENFLLYKTDNSIHIAISNHNHTYLHQMIEKLAFYGYENPDAYEILTYLIEQNAMCFQQDPFVICLMYQKELVHTLFVFDLQQEEVFHGTRISQIQIVIMDPNDNVLAVKQADSYVRRMQQNCVL